MKRPPGILGVPLLIAIGLFMEAVSPPSMAATFPERHPGLVMAVGVGALFGFVVGLRRLFPV